MHAERLLHTFFDLTRIDSPSREEGAVAHYCQRNLEELGFTVTFDDSSEKTGSEVGNLIAWLPGNLDDNGTSAVAQSVPPIVLTAHMDCVQPCRGVEPELREPELKGPEASESKTHINVSLSSSESLICSKGETVLGSDDKAGVASILEAARCVVEAEIPHRGIVVVFTVCEEIGCLGAKYLDQELFNQALSHVCPGREAGVATQKEGNSNKGDSDESDVIPCVVFDSDGAAGTIIIGAPYHYTFVADITGRASHAGVEPEVGVSAISIASDAIAHVPWGRLDDETTSNIGRIEGGQVNNIVAQSCTVTGECRSLFCDRVEKVRTSITDAFENACKKFIDEEDSDENMGLDLRWTLEYPGFFYDETDELIRFLSDAVTTVGLEPVYKTTGGGSDANVLASKGVAPVVVGVGMTNFHTVNEYILVKDLENSARFAEQLMGV